MYHSECNMQSLTHKNRNRLTHECKDLNHEIYNTTHKRTEINKNKRGTTQKYGRTNRTKTTHTYVYMYIYIRRPRPLPRQGRRLGPPEVWNLALGSQAKAHAIKATPLSATCPSHLHAPAELLHLHAPAICFSGRSRLPFARPQTLQTLPQASKATTLTATTCPCHLFFRGFKTAVCPPSNPPNASNPPAGLQGNNSYSYMPLPSVF